LVAHPAAARFITGVYRAMSVVLQRVGNLVDELVGLLLGLSARLEAAELILEP
jgi:hypothetical protein